jgi:hypothetical protein
VPVGIPSSRRSKSFQDIPFTSRPARRFLGLLGASGRAVSKGGKASWLLGGSAAEAMVSRLFYRVGT